MRIHTSMLVAAVLLISCQASAFSNISKESLNKMLFETVSNHSADLNDKEQLAGLALTQVLEGNCETAFTILNPLVTFEVPVDKAIDKVSMSRSFQDYGKLLTTIIAQVGKIDSDCATKIQQQLEPLVNHIEKIDPALSYSVNSQLAINYRQWRKDVLADRAALVAKAQMAKVVPEVNLTGLLLTEDLKHISAIADRGDIELGKIYLHKLWAGNTETLSQLKLQDKKQRKRVEGREGESALRFMPSLALKVRDFTLFSEMVKILTPNITGVGVSLYADAIESDSAEETLKNVEAFLTASPDYGNPATYFRKRLRTVTSQNLAKIEPILSKIPETGDKIEAMANYSLWLAAEKHVDATKWCQQAKALQERIGIKNLRKETRIFNINAAMVSCQHVTGMGGLDKILFGEKHLRKTATSIYRELASYYISTHDGVAVRSLATTDDPKLEAMVWHAAADYVEPNAEIISYMKQRAAVLRAYKKLDKLQKNVLRHIDNALHRNQFTQIVNASAQWPDVPEQPGYSPSDMTETKLAALSFSERIKYQLALSRHAHIKGQRDVAWSFAIASLQEAIANGNDIFIRAALATTAHVGDWDSALVALNHVASPIEKAKIIDDLINIRSGRTGLVDYAVGLTIAYAEMMGRTS